ncbi:hypothetical protein [Streptomyces sp. NPDC008121]|uniref:hypothetical protein n=1 Tax=Streptomyces sp. NPDC008121 TaxID=3364809 RepID=UPI0036E52CF1
MTTAAGFPAEIKIQTGPADCTEALDVFTRYYKALDHGEAPGSGGGGPVKVSDWTCQSPSYAERDKQPTCVRGATTVAAYIQMQ